MGPIVINEIHYHPQGVGPEFVELKNITQHTVLLYDPQHPRNTWHVGGIDFQFPTGTSIHPGGLLIISNAEPSDFGSHYAIPDDVPVLGPFLGILQDSGERLELLKPDEPDTDSGGSEIVPYIVIDAVRYNDNPPWPSEPDGNGPSLEKLKPKRHGNDSANWRSSPGGPSPGVENMGNRPPRVMAGVDQVIETESLPVSVHLSGMVSDDANPDFPTVKTSWSLSNNQTTVIFTNSGELQTTAELFGLGKHTFRLNVDDAQYTVSDELTVEIKRAPMERTFIAAGSEWRYLDNGSNQRTKWRARLFDDIKWKAGPAQLGYGDNGEKTELSFGGNSSNKHVTSYFRHSFEVTTPTGVISLEAALVRDDGAAAYLNGKEILRSNMPQGNIRYDTLASLTVGGEEESAFQPFTVDPILLVEGKNVIAVEVHQTSRTSSDISFDFELRGKGSDENQPPKVLPFNDLTLAWPSPIKLEVQVSDDALPSTPGQLAMRWKLKSGPGSVTLIDDRLGVTAPMHIGHSRRHRGATTASFSEPGTYVLIFVADDGQAQSMRELVIHAEGNSFAAWQHAHFALAELGQAIVSGPDADPDNDGMSNQDEYIAGTDPKDAKSRLEIRMIQMDATGEQLSVYFHSAPNRSYRLLQSPNVLGPWQTAGELNGPPNGGPVKLVVPLGQIQFFRLEIPSD